MPPRCPENISVEQSRSCKSSKPVASQLNRSGDRLWLPDAAAAVIPSNAPQSDTSVQDGLNLAPTGPEHCTLEQTSIYPTVSLLRPSCIYYFRVLV